MYQYFITSEPFYQEHTGDFDYNEKYLQYLPKITNDSVFSLNTKNKPELHLQNYVLENLTKNASDSKLFMKNYFIFKDNSIRKKVIDYFLNFILEKKKQNNQQILIIQFRAPETGIVFFPEDILLFKNNSIKVIIVCHELFINFVRPYLKNITIKVCNQANLTFFFNKIDYEEAVKFGFKNKYAFTQGLITLNIPYNRLIPTLDRPSNILFFGLIRPNKGFLNTLEMAKILKEKKENMKIYVLGKCEINNPLIKAWIKKINSDVVDPDLNVLSPYKDYIEIILNPSDEQIFEKANLCQYAYKSDGKGFANNASSLLNLMALGCILFTKSSQFTDYKLIDKKSKNYETIIFQNKISTSLLNNQTPKPNFVLNKILYLNNNPQIKKNIIIKSKNYLLKNHNTLDIIKNFIKDIHKIFIKNKKSKNKKLKKKMMINTFSHSPSQVKRLSLSSKTKHSIQK